MTIDKGQLNRRSFLKGLIALGTVAALPGGLLSLPMCHGTTAHSV
jgi:hypothetical protein